MYIYVIEYMCIYRSLYIYVISTSFLYFITRCILYISIQYICVCGNICLCVYIYTRSDYSLGRIYPLPRIHCALRLRHISLHLLHIYYTSSRCSLTIHISHRDMCIEICVVDVEISLHLLHISLH